MFGESKTLIVVSKDEMAINQLKKIVESDKEKFPSVKVVAWTEKVWNANKKSGNIESKVLFLGDVKGTDKLIPVVDEKYNCNGVKYGWAGKQAVIYTEIKELNAQDKYDVFFGELETLPIPDMLKKRVTPSKAIEEDIEDEAQDIEVDTDIVNEEEDTAVKKKKVSLDAIKKLGGKLKEGTEFVGDMASKAGNGMTSLAQEVFKDRALMKKQMLFYGVIRMCEDGLEEFINS